jgi:para-aminobenzoate synthetase/4-amino-4-deoxychorismate lyase
VSSTPNTTPALAEGFVLLDNSTSLEAVSELFEHPTEIIRADAPEDVDAALAALTAGLARGLHAAGFFSYELGYLLEPKLASLLPGGRKMPLLWFGLYSAPREMMGSEVQGQRFVSQALRAGSEQHQQRRHLSA